MEERLESRGGHGVLYALFLFSGASGLIYQVVWVRQFANVFGNTVYSAAAVTAVFMSGLGLGGYFGGRWADRLFARRAAGPLAAYARVELAIAALGGALALVLPRLEGLSAAISRYAVGEGGWLEISLGSSIARCVVAVALLAPVTSLMGATLTLLIRHVVGSDVGSAGFKIGVLYAVNTAGAACGCVATDLLLIPAVGLRATQLVAVALNLVAALGAVRLASVAVAPVVPAEIAEGAAPATVDDVRERRSFVALAAALVLTGFVGMAFEIVWFRHLTSIVGPFRYVFSIMLAIILVGLWVGSALGGLAHRRFGRPLLLLGIAQAALVVVALGALLSITRDGFFESLAQIHAWADGRAPWLQALAAYWPPAKPILACCAAPSILMGTVFPLANAHAQRVTAVVGARAGVLYLANTAGAVLGSLVVGFVFLPSLGTQRTIFAVAACAVAALAPLVVAVDEIDRAAARRLRRGLFACAGVGLVALAAFGGVPPDALLRQVVPTPPEGSKTLAAREGIGETVAVVETAKGRDLHTNGHPMSANDVGSQRYMRLFAHAPLLLMDRPRDVAVICFGVGNTLSAALLHDEIERADLIDVSRNVLSHAHWFAATNRDALRHPKVRVHVNDGRQHLRMMAPASYDLVTLEPPPIAHAGVASLYSREFYELARSRLRHGGMMTQWLPLAHLTADLTASLVRAFVDVFPVSVLLAGSPPELLLLGVNGDEIAADPAKIEAKLSAAPAVAAELRTIFVDDLDDLLGTFVASAATLRRITARAEPITDDAPRMEYQPPRAQQRPGGILDVFHPNDPAAWCPACLDGRAPDVHLVPYLEVMKRLYASGVFWNRTPVNVTISARGMEAVGRSRYLKTWLGVPVSP
ncbi:MAG: hypothetical protein KF819_30950 [Labilithrix sp.]|nr:hypothetical protein [Labilithrix sp.]